jgi:hypothetical protein
MGVFGSEDCLSMRIGFGLKTAAGFMGGLGADCDVDTVRI